MQAAAQPVVPEQPHHLVEQSLLAFQPVHRGVAELLIHPVQVEVDRFAMAENLAQQVLKVVPERIVEIRGQLMGRLPLVNDVPQLAVDRPRPAEVVEQPYIRPLELFGLAGVHLLAQLGTAQQMRGQRPHDRAVPDLHPLFHQDAAREPLARLDDDFCLGQALLRNVAVNRVLMRLEILQAAKVDGLARPELSHNDPDHRVVGAGRQVTIGGITAEVDEFADYILDVSA